MTTVDLAREALVGHRFAEARQRLQDIIDQDSTNADALCECLICDCYYGSEQASADRFEYLTELAATSQNKPQRLNDLELLLYRLMHLNNLLFYYVSLTQYLIGWFKHKRFDCKKYFVFG